MNVFASGLVALIDILAAKYSVQKHLFILLSNVEDYQNVTLDCRDDRILQEVPIVFVNRYVEPSFGPHEFLHAYSLLLAHQVMRNDVVVLHY